MKNRVTIAALFLITVCTAVGSAADKPAQTVADHPRVQDAVAAWSTWASNMATKLLP